MFSIRERVSPISVVKSTGPKLVPFFKTVVIFFILFDTDSRLESIFYCIVKCLPVVSLIFFVLLHGMSFNEYYAYSRKILLGLVFSALGDAFLVWKNAGYFIHGLLMFAVAQFLYILAFGIRPLDLRTGSFCALLAALVYTFLLPGFDGLMVYLGGLYIVLICTMAWRAIARVKFLNDQWTWTGLSSCGGAIFFLISDLVIAVDKFRFSVPYSHQIIMLTYYAAQMGIAVSVVDSQFDFLIQQTQTDRRGMKKGDSTPDMISVCSDDSGSESSSDEACLLHEAAGKKITHNDK